MKILSHKTEKVNSQTIHIASGHFYRYKAEAPH